MMKQIPFTKILLLLFAVFFSACSKDAPEAEEPYEGYGYIRGYFGTEYLNFEYPINIYAEFTGEIIPGIHENRDDWKGGQLHLLRGGKRSGTDRRLWDIQISGVKLDEMPVPYTVNSSSYFSSDHIVRGYLQIRDMATPIDVIISGPDDSYNYEGATRDDDVTIEVISKKDDIITGTFEGQLKTTSGLVMPVKGGEFRVKIERK
ncbi:hypothetical protein D770_22740 [Flammeovirgaceae bacterium 311]|nr:hypothetical protein D770_22740 [Flammeovirgaceae bacterium 311]